MKTKIDFELDIPYYNVEINTDKTKLIQVISNLLSNAMKFTSKGNIH